MLCSATCRINACALRTPVYAPPRRRHVVCTSKLDAAWSIMQKLIWHVALLHTARNRNRTIGNTLSVCHAHNALLSSLCPVIYLQQASCLVNPRAGYETTLNLKLAPGDQRRRIAVVGSGPAGLAAATGCAERGHNVTLFEGAGQLGGQVKGGNSNTLTLSLPSGVDASDVVAHFTLDAILEVRRSIGVNSQLQRLWQGPLTLCMALGSARRYDRFDIC